MHSFFQPKAKKAKLEPKQQPRSILSWNVNGLLSVVADKATSKPAAELKAFIKSESPDILVLQEVMFPAAEVTGAARKRSALSGKGKVLEAQKAVLERSFRDGGVFEDYTVKWSLSDRKYAGTALLIKKEVVRPTSIRYNLDISLDPDEHEEEGRVICATFEQFTLLMTYSPNNSGKKVLDEKGVQLKDEHGVPKLSFAKRQHWDGEVTQFVEHMKGQHKPLVYVGDLNCAHLDCDLSHPSFFRTTMASRFNAPDEADRGQPGCTTNERLRFSALMEAGGLIDVYRTLHPPPQPEAVVNTDEPIYTWRGVGEDSFAYGGKGMRIDHCLVSEAFVEQVSDVLICGRGIGPHVHGEGFYGSDHCPIMVKLKSFIGANAEK